MTITWQAEDSVEPIADTTIEGIANFTNYSVTAGCGLSYSASTMAVTVAAGSVLHNGVTVVVAGNSVTLVADATNPRWTWIGIPSSGTADIVSGTAAAIPSVPEIGDRVPLALVYVQAILAIANNATYKLDKRVMYSGVNALMTTSGDMVYASGANTPVRLAKGTARQALLMNSGATAPEWASSPQSLLTTTGDVLYASSANTPARLGIGSSAQVLTVTSGVPAWGTVSSGWTTITSGTYTSVTSLSIAGSLSSYRRLQLLFDYESSSSGINPSMRLNGSSTAAYSTNIVSAFFTYTPVSSYMLSTNQWYLNYNISTSSIGSIVVDINQSNSGQSFAVSQASCTSGLMNAGSHQFTSAASTSVDLQFNYACSGQYILLGN